MIRWDTLEQKTKHKAYSSMRKIINAGNYGTGEGQWTLTELVQTDDSRKYNALQILDGVDFNCRRPHGLDPLMDDDGSRFKFRFRVTTRQACIRSASGETIFASKQAYMESGENGILPLHTDPPIPGDVVEWKGQMKVYDDEKGRKVDGRILKEWALRGIRPETFIEFKVDQDGCIAVPYPYAYAMLTRKGKSLAFPKFTKQLRGKVPARRIINWWFEEVPKDFKAFKSRKKS